MKKKLYLIICICSILLFGCEDKELQIETVANKIKSIDNIKNVCIASVDNKISKELINNDGFKEALYFKIDDIDTEEFKNDTSCNIGTISGGSIEIYENENKAEKREDYLKSMNNSISGEYYDHEDNIVIKLSNKLSLSQQEVICDQIEREIENIK